MFTTFEQPSNPKKERIHQNSRRRLQEIRDTIREPQTVHLGQGLCKIAGIIHQAQSLSLDEASKSRPIFFDSYKNELDDLTEPDDLRHEYNKEWHDVNQAGTLGLFIESYVDLHRPKGIPGSDYTE